MKKITLAALLAASALLLIAVNAPWLSVRIDVQGVPKTVSVSGQSLAPVLSALALASLALTGALAIAERAFRIILGAVQVLFGTATVLSSLPGYLQPLREAAGAVTKATGVAGAASTAALVDNLTVTAWPGVSIAAGLLGALIGAAVLFGARRWPESRKRYTASPSPQRNSADDWERLSDGEDPTSGRAGSG